MAASPTVEQLPQQALQALLRLAVTSPEMVTERAQQLGAFARACATAGHDATCDEALSAGLRLLREVVATDADPVPIAASTHALGRQAETLGRTALARDAYLLVVTSVDAAVTPVPLSIVWHDIGDTWQAERNCREALAAYRTAAELQTASSTHLDRAEALADLAEAEASCGDEDAAKQAIAHAAALLADAPAGESEDHRALRKTALDLGRLASGQRHGALARDLLATALRHSESLKDADALGIVWHAIGRTWEKDDDWPQALVCFRTAAELKAAGGSAFGKRLDRVTILTELAEAEDRCGDRCACEQALTDAVRLLTATVGSADADDDRNEAEPVAHHLGRCAERLGQPATARRAYLLIARLVSPEEDPVLLGVAWHDIGDTWRSDGDWRQALASYRTAAEFKRASPHPADRATTFRALAEAAARCDDQPACDRALADAFEVLSAAAGAAEPEWDAIARGAEALAGLAGQLERPAIAREARELRRRVEATAEARRLPRRPRWRPFGR